MKGTHLVYDKMSLQQQADLFSGIKPNESYDALEWTQFFDHFDKVVNGTVPLYKAGTGEGHLILCLHGAGHSAMSFACLAAHLKSDCTVYAFDWRGHGDHFCENESDLSQETLIGDTVKVMEFVMSQNPGRSINLIGHSMGGSIATKAAAYILSELADQPISKALSSLLVVDVVEGTAMEHLPFMEQVVNMRPVHF